MLKLPWFRRRMNTQETDTSDPHRETSADPGASSCVTPRVSQRVSQGSWISEGQFLAARRRVFKTLRPIRDVLQADAAVCSITGLTGREKKLLVESWRRLVGSGSESCDKAVEALGRWIAENIPLMRKRLEESDMFPEHTRLFFGVFNDCLEDLDEPFLLMDTLSYLALFHLKQDPPVLKREILSFRNGFPLFVKSYLSLKENAKDNETLAAWHTLLDVVYKTFERVQSQHHKPKTKCCNIV